MSDQEADVNDAKGENPFGRTCDNCEQPATHSATDVALSPDYTVGYMHARPVGGVKYGCDKHPVSTEFHKFERPAQ